ncbi:bifunctional metallophosphatase/5'-nucleotidase [Paenibacillus sp. TAB 01]|uniref:bifunctional metallophosphatase/5'-nucleotidase n=1 Tax=Paenibacillus sp. TAB 01 TaxID=3368988 RepID=UPI0037520B34
MSLSPLRLRILHSNDIHSHFEQMPLIAEAFEELRLAMGDAPTLTLDIGDHLDRVSPITEGSEGRANLDIMTATGYDAITIGNNEGLTFPAEALNELYGSVHSSMKVLCSNLKDTATGDYPSWGAPYCIVNKGGIEIGMIGVTACYPDFYSLLGWTIEDPLPVVAELVGQLRPKVDLIVVLSHLGLKQDERMASDIQGIDLILGGHTHHLLEQPLRIGSAMLCGAGKFGQYIGVVDIGLEPVTRKPMQMEGYVRELKRDDAEQQERQEPSPSSASLLGQRLEERIAKHRLEAGQVLDREAAWLEQAMAADSYQEAPLGNLLAQALRQFTGADIGLVNAGQFLEGLEPGRVTLGRLLDICPSPINPSLMLLSGQQILQALEESLLPEFTEKRIYGFGFRGKVLGMLNVDGMTVEYDPDGPAYGKIRQVRLGGCEPLRPEREYKVGSIDMFTFGTGYLSLSQSRHKEYFLPEFIRDLIRRALNDPEAILMSGNRRWIPVPHA